MTADDRYDPATSSDFTLTGLGFTIQAARTPPLWWRLRCRECTWRQSCQTHAGALIQADQHMRRRGHDWIVVDEVCR